MAYVKQNWECGETITADKLNHMEDGIANAGGGECGYECEETVTLLTEESVTTTTQDNYNEGALSYSQLIDAETIKVTFNGTEYECDRRNFIGNNNYIYGGEYGPGGTGFSTYPFIILSLKGLDDVIENVLNTETAGTYSVKIEGMLEKVTTTPCFEKAVKSVVGDAVYVKMHREYDTSTRCESYTLDLTATELRSIIENGQQLVIVDDATFGAIYYPTYMWAKNTTPILRVGPAVGEAIARVIVTVRDVYGDERLLTLSAVTLSADAGTLSQNLTGTLCGTVEDLRVPLNQDISRATASAPAKSISVSYDEIMYALGNGATVYIVEANKATHLVTSFYKDSSNKINSTVTVNVETTDGNLGITYSKPITFHFDADGYAYYPASAT